ncbi:MAG: hypothetical protein ACRBF0_16570 [Calditrichia bacterium]
MSGTREFFVILSVICLFLFSSCSLFNSSEDSVDARIVVDRLAIENNTSEPIYYFAVGELTAQVFRWAPLVSDENRIKSGEKALLTFEELYVRENEEKLFVYWWKGEEDSGEITHGEVQTLTVDLK